MALERRRKSGERSSSVVDIAYETFSDSWYVVTKSLASETSEGSGNWGGEDSGGSLESNAVEFDAAPDVAKSFRVRVICDALGSNSASDSMAYE